MRSYTIIAGVLAVMLSAAVIATSASAQNAQAGKLGTKTTGANIRASHLIGMNIENDQEQAVGEVNDIVIDANTGQVRYAAVTYGGFLGVGNKMFAVPFEAFQCRPDPDDPDEYVLVLNVTQKQLEGSTGFNEDHWPNFVDQKFTSELHKRYGVSGIDRKHDGISQAVDPANTGVNVRDRDISAKTPFDQYENQKDIDITANIRKRVVDTEMSVNAQNVKIITQDGKVTLRGPVKSADEKTQIEKLAQDVAGTTNVDNQLEVQP